MPCSKYSYFIALSEERLHLIVDTLSTQVIFNILIQTTASNLQDFGFPLPLLASRFIEYFTLIFKDIVKKVMHNYVKKTTN